jgi:hypothetical protein
MKAAKLITSFSRCGTGTAPPMIPAVWPQAQFCDILIMSPNDLTPLYFLKKGALSGVYCWDGKG